MRYLDDWTGAEKSAAVELYLDTLDDSNPDRWFEAMSKAAAEGPLSRFTYENIEGALSMCMMSHELLVAHRFRIDPDLDPDGLERLILPGLIRRVHARSRK